MDLFNSHRRSLTSPPTAAHEVVPDDVQGLGQVPRAIYVGGAGNLKVRMQDGDVVTLVAVPQGSFLPIRVAQVFREGTTATLLVAFW
jgi:hypothetical protein